MTDIPKLDDSLDPLHQGVWEVTIQKDQVTEPLDSTWERSFINIPTPGTLASYRKGHYHVHETSTEWKVHLDRYDPKVHPFLHLVDDAPLLLMIADTYATLVASVKKSPAMKTGVILKEQRRTWQILVLLGFALGLTAIWIMVDPLLTFGGIIHYLLPSGIMILGIFISRKGIGPGAKEIISPGSLILGISVFFLGIVTFFLPIDMFVQVLLLVLSFWAFASAWMSFSQVARGKNAVPEGFYRRGLIGVFSLLLALLILLVPDAMLALLIEILGALLLLLGITLGTGGWRLREKMKNVART